MINYIEIGLKDNRLNKTVEYFEIAIIDQNIQLIDKLISYGIEIDKNTIEFAHKYGNYNTYNFVKSNYYEDAYGILDYDTTEDGKEIIREWKTKISNGFPVRTITHFTQTIKEEK